MRPSRVPFPSESREAPHSRLHDLVVEQVRETLAEVKPRLRGWLHLGLLPLTVVGGIVLLELAGRYQRLLVLAP